MVYFLKFVLYHVCSILGNVTDTLNKLKTAIDDEINSVTNCLRNTFLNRAPTLEDILKTCETLAEKLR